MTIKIATMFNSAVETRDYRVKTYGRKGIVPRPSSNSSRCKKVGKYTVEMMIAKGLLK